MDTNSLARRRKKLHAKQDGKCYWCATPMSLDTVNYEGVAPDHNMCTLDHVIPKSMGGSNRVGNMVASCWLCNTLRSSTDPASTMDVLPHRRQKYLAKKEKEKKNGSVGNSG